MEMNIKKINAKLFRLTEPIKASMKNDPVIHLSL